MTLDPTSGRTDAGRLPHRLSEALDQFARLPRILVAMDFDGTLAPLVDEPMDARALPGSSELLSGLAALADTLVAIVSGRDLATLRELSGMGEPLVLIGSHGVEGSHYPTAPGADTAERARFEALDEDLAEMIRAHPLARIERKPHSLVLHTRGLSDQDAEAAVRAAEAVLTRHTGLVVTPGKGVLEMATQHVGKGTALHDLAREREVDAVLFVGDDVTDEEAFAVLPPPHVTIKVGSGDTVATHRVADEADVQLVLRELLARRRAD
ncbi:trehalose-phosphatase [Ornithinimicrobium cavernae]|uniref:trehalose-phosphatase n=1 Tax=Ornithinimicrobium cavernae TaxID=2666047 RepID=UPI000D697E92|nr:trehalose-phosphatase [Ornithinimicrobium cavernae]